MNEFIEEIKKIKLIKDKCKNGIDINDISITNKKRTLEVILAEEEFNNLLKEKIKNEISWKEAERKLNNEKEWKNEKLTNERKIELFKDYVHNLRELRKKSYCKLLEEKIGLNQEITWHQAQHMLQGDHRYREVQPRDREMLYNEYMTNVKETIVQEFSQFLEQTELLSHDSPTEGPYLLI